MQSLNPETARQQPLSACAGETGESSDGILVSVVMPCLNEEEAIGSCIEKIQRTFREANIPGEIVVADNGSTDRSVEIALSMGARVVHQPERGYGNAYLKGFSEARGHYLVMGDADDTYDFGLIPEFVGKMQKDGYEFVTGSRYLGKGDEHITWLHRYVGNPLLTFGLNWLFGTAYTDVYCGYRAFSRKAYERIAPVSPGMEFNLELAINAKLAGLRATEIPIQLAPRKGKSKLNTLQDGWRSLRMMLLYCPNKVFMIPGLTLFFIGCTIHLLVLIGVQYQGRQFGPVSGIFGTVFTVVGFQILALGLHAKTYSWSRRFDPDQKFLARFYDVFKLEAGLLLGVVMVGVGIWILGALAIEWLHGHFDPLPHPEWASLGATLVIIGFCTLFSSLFISAMSITKDR